MDSDNNPTDTSDVDFDMVMKNPASDALHWGAPPLNMYSSSDLFAIHEAARGELEARSISAPDDLAEIPPGVQSYVHQNFMSRYMGRVMANFDNYTQRLKKDSDGIDSKVIAMHDRAVVGTASPAELLCVRSAYGIGSIGLGCAIIPYGNSIEQLESMRDTVAEAILMMNGELLDSKPVLKLKQTDTVVNPGENGHLKDAFLMTRKRDLGRLPDGTIVRERSSFVIRIDEASGFDQELAERMRRVDAELSKNLRPDVPKNKHWGTTVMTVGMLKKKVPPLLETNDFAAAIPLSTTIYAFNTGTLDEIERVRAEEEARVKIERQLSIQALLDAPRPEVVSEEDIPANEDNEKKSRVRSIGKTLLNIAAKAVHVIR